MQERAELSNLKAGSRVQNESQPITYELAIMSPSHAVDAVIATAAIKGSNLHSHGRQAIP